MAVAVSVKLAGALVTVLLAGAVILTVGADGQTAAWAIVVNNKLLNMAKRKVLGIAAPKRSKPAQLRCHRLLLPFTCW